MQGLERLKLLIEQCRPEVGKLFVLQALEGTAQEKLDELTYGEIETDVFLKLLERHAARSPGTCDWSAEGTTWAPGGRRRFYDLGSGTGKCVLLAVRGSSATSACFAAVHLLCHVRCEWGAGCGHLFGLLRNVR